MHKLQTQIDLKTSHVTEKIAPPQKKQCSFRGKSAHVAAPPISSAETESSLSWLKQPIINEREADTRFRLEEIVHSTLLHNMFAASGSAVKD